MKRSDLSSTVARARRSLAVSGLRHPVVKIHGQQRAGTNFVHRLIKTNAANVICPWPEEMGWKHGPYEFHRRWKYLVVARHPMAWIESLHDWEVKHGRSTSETITEFLRAPSVDPRLAEVWGTIDPYEIYATSYSAWLGSPLTTAVVRYEDLLTDLEPALDKLFRDLGLARPNEVADVSDRADVWESKIERRPLDRDRSLHGWLDAASDTDLEIASARIPASVLEQLGYTI